MKTKTKLMIGFFLLGVAAIVGQALYKSYLGEGAAVVFAPPTRSAVVTMDGGQPATIPAGEYRRYSLAQGAHQMKAVVDGQEHLQHFEIASGHSQMGVPVTAEQCYVALDVSSSHYKVGLTGDGGPKPLPYLSKRYREAEAFRLPKVYAFKQEQLPPSKGQGVGAYLFETVPCAALAMENNQLVRAMGFKGDPVRYKAPVKQP